MYFSTLPSLLAKKLSCPHLLIHPASAWTGGTFLDDSLAFDQTLLMHPKWSCFVGLPNSSLLCNKDHLVWPLSQMHEVLLERYLICPCYRTSKWESQDSQLCALPPELMCLFKIWDCNQSDLPLSHETVSSSRTTAALCLIYFCTAGTMPSSDTQQQSDNFRNLVCWRWRTPSEKQSLYQVHQERKLNKEN